MKREIGLKEKLLLGIIPLIIIVIVIINGVFYKIASKVVINLHDEQAENFIRFVDKELDNWITQVKDDAVIISNADVVKKACSGQDIENARRFLSDAFNVKDIYENIFIADPEGKIFLAAVDKENAEGIDLMTLPPYKTNAQKSGSGQVWLSGVNKSPASGRPVVLLTVPIKKDGLVIGILGTPVELNNFSKEYIDMIKSGENGYAYMADADGVIIAHPDKKLIFNKNLKDFDFGPEMLQIKNGKQQYVFKGVKKIQYFRTNRQTGWIVSMTDSIEEALLSNLKHLKTIVFLLGTAAVLLVGVVIWFLVNSTLKIIEKLYQKLSIIATKGGDLTQRLEGGGDDEVGRLVNSFNEFMDKLHSIMSQIKGSVRDFVAASNEISATSAQLATGVEEQTSQSSEIAASVQEMTASIVENAKNVTHASNLATKANDKASEGKTAVRDAKEGAEAVASVTEKAVSSVNSLAGRAGQIGEVIEVINDIADQTNLLALNAAIEAARAGGQGRGFAVVADEVRKLAERTTKATQEIAETIHAIQNDTEETSRSMEEAQKKVVESVDAALKTEHVLEDIAGAVNTMMDMMTQIAAATEEMSSGAEEISKNMDSISQVTRESATGAEQMSIAAEELRNQAEKINNLINRFAL